MISLKRNQEKYRKSNSKEDWSYLRIFLERSVYAISHIPRHINEKRVEFTFRIRAKKGDPFPLRRSIFNTKEPTHYKGKTYVVPYLVEIISFNKLTTLKINLHLYLPINTRLTRQMSLVPYHLYTQAYKYKPTWPKES